VPEDSASTINAEGVALCGTRESSLVKLFSFNSRGHTQQSRSRASESSRSGWFAIKDRPIKFGMMESLTENSDEEEDQVIGVTDIRTFSPTLWSRGLRARCTSIQSPMKNLIGEISHHTTGKEPTLQQQYVFGKPCRSCQREVGLPFLHRYFRSRLGFICSMLSARRGLLFMFPITFGDQFSPTYSRGHCMVLQDERLLHQP
jgi:hypothetical protein